VVVGDGEELDEEIWAQEGYGREEFRVSHSEKAIYYVVRALVASG